MIKWLIMKLNQSQFCRKEKLGIVVGAVFFLAGALVQNSFSYANYSNWVTETVDNSAGVGKYQSIAYDQSNHPHVVYLKSNELIYGFRDMEGWHYASVSSSAEGIPILVLDRHDRPHILLVENVDLERHLRYKFMDAEDTWHTENVISGIPGTHSHDLALDSNGEVHISYCYADLIYTFHDETGWHEVVVDEKDGLHKRCLHTAIALDGNNGIHIAYNMGSLAPDTKAVKYAYGNGENWQLSEIGACGWYLSLALDQFGQPQVAYSCHYFQDQGLILAYQNGSVWQQEIVDPGGNYSYVSLVLDQRNNPHIAYDLYDESQGIWQLSYAHKNDFGWSNEQMEALGDERSFATMALDANDSPGIVRFNSILGDILYFHKLASLGTELIFLPAVFR